jgi:hypothetical protein
MIYEKVRVKLSDAPAYASERRIGVTRRLGVVEVVARGVLGLKSLKASLTPVGPPSARECGGYLVLSEPQVRFGPHVHGEQVQFRLSQPTDWMVSLLPPFGADTRRCRGRRKTQHRLADPKISATFTWTSTVVNARG